MPLGMALTLPKMGKGEIGQWVVGQVHFTWDMGRLTGKEGDSFLSRQLRNSPSLTVKCQTSHVPCEMHLSNHPLTGCPADPISSLLHCSGAPVPGELTESFRPSAKVISRPFARGDPSFA